MRSNTVPMMTEESVETAGSALIAAARDAGRGTAAASHPAHGAWTGVGAGIVEFVRAA